MHDCIERSIHVDYSLCQSYGLNLSYSHSMVAGGLLEIS